MLDALKKYASGWVAQLLLAILVLSFAVWGVSDVFTGFGRDAIASVGSTEVPLSEFQRRYDVAIQSVSRQIGQTLTREQAVRYGVPNQVLAQLVYEATLDHAAGQMGLGLSNKMLGQEIADDPTLVGPSGKFDRNYLNQAIAAQHMTEDDFIINRRAAYIRDQLVAALTGDFAVPDVYMQAIHDYTSEQRTVSYLVVPAPPASAIAEPSETDLSTYFEAHKADWRAPEFRAIQYFTLTPDQIADPSAVSDADAKQRYDEQQARFAKPEKRQVEQIVFKDSADAAAAAAALNSGTTFDQLIAQRNLKPSDVDLGLITRDKIIDPTVADAAFSLPDGGTSGVVDGKFGPVIVHVTKIEPAVVTSFDDAKATLKKEIARERAANDIVNLHNSIEDARAGGATLAEAASKYDLKLMTINAVDAKGNGPDGKPVADLPNGLLKAAFQADAGAENDPIQPDRESYAWYQVTNITQPRDRLLGEVHDQVVAAWKNEQRAKKLAAEAAAIKTRLDGGEAMATVAADLSLTSKTGETVTRLSKPTDDLSADAVSQIFSEPKSTAAVVAGAKAMTDIVFTVDDITTPAYFSGAQDLARIDKQMSQQIADDTLAIYAAQLRSRTEVRLNQAALKQVLGVAAN